ncbi:hypothetical protein TMatcc_009401 [Talaromyces marneffei ATCC 18224]
MKLHTWFYTPLLDLMWLRRLYTLRNTSLMEAVLAPCNHSHGCHAATSGYTPMRKIPQTKMYHRCAR